MEAAQKPLRPNVSCGNVPRGNVTWPHPLSIRRRIRAAFPGAAAAYSAKVWTSSGSQPLRARPRTFTAPPPSRRRTASLTRAVGRLPHTICYAVKANSNLSILRLLARLGAGFDIVSGGELYRLRRAGIPAGRVVFSGVGKSREEIREALRARIRLFNVESEAELDLLASEAARLRWRAPGGRARES